MLCPVVALQYDQYSSRALTLPPPPESAARLFLLRAPVIPARVQNFAQTAFSRKFVPESVRGELGAAPESPAEVLHSLLDPRPVYLRLLESPSSPWGSSL